VESSSGVLRDPTDLVLTLDMWRVAAHPGVGGGGLQARDRGVVSAREGKVAKALVPARSRGSWSCVGDVASLQTLR